MLEFWKKGTQNQIFSVHKMLKKINLFLTATYLDMCRYVNN